MPLREAFLRFPLPVNGQGVIQERAGQSPGPFVVLQAECPDQAFGAGVVRP